MALFASLIVWNLPFGGVLLYPFKLLATWMHELSHGLVMMITGAGFDRMEIYRDTSGISFAEHGVGPGVRAAIAGAGYMGTPLGGAIILMLGQSRPGPRVVLAGLGLLMGMTAMFFVNGAFGMAAVSTGAIVCLAMAALAGERTAGFLANLIAVQACINALLDIRVLFRQNLVINGKVAGASDAHNMAAATFGTPALWAAVWLLWSFALLYAALRLVHMRQQETIALERRKDPER